MRLTRQPGVAELTDEPVQQVEHDVTSAERRQALDRQLFGRLGDVGLVLEQDVQGLLGDLLVDRLDVEQHQRARPVERLRHARRLLEVELADRADDAGDLVGEVVGDARHLGEHDLLLALERRVVDVEVEAAPLQRLGQLAGVVRRQEHERDLLGDDRAQLGDRHLVVGQDLEQQRLGLDLDPVDLVDQQHDGILGADRLEQRAGQEELVGEDVVVDLAPRVGVLVGLDAQQLLLVVPLVQRFGLVEPLVALEADQPGAGHLRRRLGELRLAGASRTLDEHRLAEPVGEEHHAGDPVVGQVVHVAEPVSHLLHALEALCCHASNATARP